LLLVLNRGNSKKAYRVGFCGAIYFCDLSSLITSSLRQGWHKQEQLFFTNRKKHVRNTCFLPGRCKKQVDYGTTTQEFQAI
jgi:hypothetical protein